MSLAVGCLAILLGPVASAKAIVILDPDQFAAGTILNNAWAGVTLTALDSPAGTVLPNANVYSVNSSYTSTGVRGFGDSEASLPDAWGDGFFDYLRADFAMGATDVYLDFIANDSGGDRNAFINAYNASGILIDSDTAAFVAAGSYVTLSVSGDIAYIEASWDAATHLENGALDNLRYEPASVPDASCTMILLGWALLGVGAVRRLRTR